ncbi:MAG: hypothetical protein OEY51_00325 [Cyclobacteriaceae bacterium]|nr:hypothetical protein [Cyclobacteriaceae bacterium]
MNFSSTLNRRVLLLSGILGVIFSAIFYLFWTNEIQYLAPTKRPENYVQVNISDSTTLKGILGNKDDRPTYIHYYNPYCPCSKFNYGYYSEIAGKYRDRFNMYLVIREMDEDVIDKIRESVTGNTTVIIDKNGEIARQTGVYSTPQAVLLNTDYTLYYRGNYNRSKYCTVKDYNYAEMAIDSLLSGRPAPLFDHFATTAYGCSLEKEREIYQVLFNIN